VYEICMCVMCVYEICGVCLWCVFVVCICGVYLWPSYPDIRC